MSRASVFKQFFRRPRFPIRDTSIRTCLKAALILTALGFAFIPLPAEWVERYYSAGIYPRLQALLTPVTNLVPFAIYDMLIVGLIAGLPIWWGVRIMRAGKGGRRRIITPLSVQTLAFAAAAFLAFQLLWGLNYLRQPLTRKLDYDQERVNTDRLTELRHLAVGQLNSEYPAARGSPWPDRAEWRKGLLDSFNRVAAELGNERGIAAARPKRSLANFYLAAAGIEGFVNPFGYEVILESGLLSFEEPFTLAHEWAHLAGFADESEASFVGLLACLRSDMAALRYAGWIAVYQYLPRGTGRGQVGGVTGEELPKLSPQVASDLGAIRQRVAGQTNHFISRVQGAVYDRFLRANRVRDGIESYGLVVRLVLGTEFKQEWRPVVREPGR